MKFMDWMGRSPARVGFDHRGPGLPALDIQANAGTVALASGLDLPVATGVTAGVMSADDKTKLDGLQNTLVTIEPVTFASRAQVTATAIDPAVTHLNTAGYQAPGDGGHALYARVASEPGHAGKVQSADGTWWEIGGYEINPLQFGAQTGSATDTVASWQTALDLVTARISQSYYGGTVRQSAGVFQFDSALTARSGIILELGHSWFEVESGDAFCNIGIGAPGASDRINRFQVNGGYLYLNAPFAAGYRIENAFAPMIQNQTVVLRNSSQIAIDIQATDAPFGPYYGHLSNLRIAGQGTETGQIGIRMQADELAATAGAGINRWSISDLRHISGVDIGLDIQGTAGQTINGVNLESIRDTGIRLGERSADYIGSVTTGGSINVITDTAFNAIENLRPAAVKVTSGPNAGHSSKVQNSSSNTITLEESLPYRFEVGDTYEYYVSKCFNVALDNVTVETSPIFVDFGAGSSACKVRTHFVGNTTTVFRRAIEDHSNTVAGRYTILQFEGTVPFGSSSVWFDPVHIASTHGGLEISESGWIDAVYCTSSTRGVGTNGLITIEPFVAGSLQSPDLQPVLTPDNPRRARRIRRELSNTELIRRGQAIKIRATAENLASNEYVRVQVYIGHY